MAINLPIAENINPYDSASLIRGQGISGALVDKPDLPTAPSPAPSPVQSAAPAPTPSLAGAAPAPAPTAAPEPTIGQTLEGIKSEALRVQAELNKRNQAKGNVTGLTYQTGKTYEELYPEINEKNIQRNQMKLFQKEIDATNRVYNDILQREKLAGTGRLGTQRAIAARGGLLGSDFGAAQESNVTSANLQAQQSIDNERLAKVGTIMGTMRKAVADEIVAKRQARQEGAKNYIDYLASSQTRREANLNLAANAFLQQGLDPSTMSPDEIDAIAKEAGVSTRDILTKYMEVKSSSEAAASETKLKTAKTQAEIDKLNADIEKGKLITIGEGTTLYNTETGEKWKNPKTYAPGTGRDSSVGLTADNKRTLLGGGYSESDIGILEDGIRSQGLQSIIDAERKAGASDSQIRALEKAYGAEESQAPSKIDRQFISNWYGIDDNDEGGNSFLGLEWGQTNKEQLDNLMSTIERYKAVGMSDEEIYKELDQ